MLKRPLQRRGSIAERLFAQWYPWLSARAEAAGQAEIRARVLAPARGRTLELGAGHGANLVHLPPAVTALTLTDPSPPMLARLRAAAGPRPGRIVRADAQALPFEDGAFDTVLATYVLCSVEDPAAALAEIARVLAPGGRFLFCEHVRAPDGSRLARVQDLVSAPHRLAAAGCRPNRRTEALIRMAPALRVERLEAGEQPSLLAVVRPIVWGVAVRAG